MEKEILVNQKQLTKEGYVIISSYFLDYCVEILGTGPAMLYIQLLNYCHKGKDLAWPTLATLGRKMQFTPKSITKFHRILLKQGLIKKINKGRTASGNYRRNIYQVIPIHRVKNTLSIGKNFPYVEEKVTPDLGKKLPTNNTNLNITNSTAANRENAAVVAVVNFKKLKEKGEENIQTIRERMVKLDLKEEFIEKILKEYSTKKIDEKLDLLMERRNIQNPAGWLRTALKNDYRDAEQGRYDEEPVRQESQPIPHPHLNPPPSRGRRDGSLILSHSIRGRRFIDCPAQKEEEFKEGLETESQLSPSKWTSREKALEAINLIKENLSLPVYPLSPQEKGP